MGRSLVVAAADVDNEVLQTLLHNKERAELSCVAINFPNEPNFPFLEDFAHFTGATLLNEHLIRDATIKDLGSCARLNIDSMRTTVFNGKGDTKLRKDQLLTEIINETDPLAQSVIKERLQRLSGKLAFFEIGVKGGKVAMAERRDRIVDSLNSIKSACKEGFLPGGGSSLLFAARALKGFRLGTEEDVGIRILQEALKEPATMIALNSNVGLTAIDQLWENLDEEMGIDVGMEEICNLVDRGIIDSTGVVRQAVRAAVSVSQMLLGTSAAISKVKRYEPTRLNLYKKQVF
jgi:chaperonin GroEL